MFDKIKHMNKYFYAWGIICIIYLLFIGYCTWLYPLTGDEIIYNHDYSLFTHLKNFIFKPFMALRIGCLFSITFLHTGLIFYKILNPFIQLFLIFSVFYFIFMRFPRFDDKVDLPSFVLIMILGTFFVAQPSDVLLWVGGATNYAWVFIAFVWFLIYLRKLSEGKHFNNKYFPILCIFWGIFLGLMNENNSPMVLCLMIAFFIYSRFKKITLKNDFLFLFLGTVIGVYILFALGGNDVRMQMMTLGIPLKRTLSEKLFIHLTRVHIFAAANLCLIFLMPLFLFLLFLDKRKVVLKNKHFYLSVLCWGTAFVLSAVLCEAPRLAIRAFFSASWFCIFSMIFMLLEIENLYRVEIIKYFAFIFLFIFLYFAPFFILGVKNLKDSVNQRQNLIDIAKKNGRGKIYLYYCRPKSANLPHNLQIIYWDPLEKYKKWSEIEGIEIEDETQGTVRYI